MSYSLPIAVAIAALILIVIASYRQTIRAYPHGGGAYIVAKENLGVFPSLIAGAALLTDYVLTVAVSVAAGVAAVTSALPELFPLRVVLCVGAVIVIALANLRGVRESGRVFVIPTFVFVVSILAMVAYGLASAMLGRLPEAPYEPHPPGLEGIGLFLLLRAFAAGCTALTGIEAVSDGVPAFKPPEAHNARIVMAWLGALTVAMFLGITYLAYDFGVVPSESETVVSKIARRVFGGGLFYYEIQIVTMLILLLAANTSFADFPRLAYFMARDGFMPRQFRAQGDRLVFSNGIVILAGLAILLLIGFQGDTQALLPLYAIGVFTSFTVSQSGMVRHWWRVREAGWWWRGWFSGVGATLNGLVLVTLAVTKFAEGAWVVLALLPLLVGIFLVIRSHYQDVAVQLSLKSF
jgi:amino acid transporter